MCKRKGEGDCKKSESENRSDTIIGKLQSIYVHIIYLQTQIYLIEWSTL